MRLLVVEDYQPIRAAVVQRLREENYAVDEAEDGELGRWFVRSNDYDLVILDLMLPKVDGLSLLKEIRTLKNPVAVIVLTARDQIPDRVRGLDVGADDYLIKPFSQDELLARVRCLLRRKYGHRSPGIQVGDLDVNTATKTVTRAGTAIALSPREYALLEYLAMRRYEVVTRTDIWEHVYDFHSDATSNVVDVYVGYLRRKLSPAGEPFLIHTRRGQGYVLKETE